MLRTRWSSLGMLVAVSLVCSLVQGAPWIQQNRWLALGPISNPSGCGGDLGTNPTPNHDLTQECPAAGDDWSDIGTLSAGAPPTWTDLGLAGVPAGDLVDWDAIAGGFGLPNENTKAIGVIYVENNTPNIVVVGVCTASDDSIKVIVNDTEIANVSACRGTAGDCAEINTAALVPGKNKIATVVYEGGGGWSFRMRLIKPDGTNIDDTNDPDFTFSTDPGDCVQDLSPFRVTRAIAGPSACTASQPKVTLTGNGQDAPAGLVTISETVAGLSSVLNVSNGGVFTPNVLPTPCDFTPDPIGQFTDHRDIGNPQFVGSTTFDGGTGTYVVTAGGDDIWAGGDHMQWAYKKLSGDFSVTAHIANRQYPDGLGGFNTYPTVNPASRWGKFGLMARQDCDLNSRYAFTHDCSPDSNATDPDSIRQAGRTTHLGADNFEAGVQAAGVHPDWIRLDRVGNVFSSYSSTDGVTWSKLADMNWGATAPCATFVGFAVTSHAGGNPIRITFDNLTITGGNAACPPTPPQGGKVVWTNIARSAVNTGLSYEIGGPNAIGPVRLSGIDGQHPIAGQSSATVGALKPVGIFADSMDVGGSAGGSTVFDAGSQEYTSISSGNDIWDGGDQFQYAYNTMAGDFDFTVQITNVQNSPTAGSRWGKFGPMARRTCEGNSIYAHTQESAGEIRDWPRFAFRGFHGNNGGSNDGQQYDYPATGQFPPYMKLVRHNNSFYGYLSENGEEWRPIGGYTWYDQDPSQPITVGFCNSAHGSSGGVPGVVKYKVLHLGPIDPTLALPLPDDNSSAGDEVFSDPFDSLDAVAWSVQHRDAAFNPTVVDGRLRLNDGLGGESTSAFNSFAIEDIDGAIHQWEFDVIMTGTGGNADGITFTVTGGQDVTRVGFGGGAEAYEGLGRSRFNNQNVGNNSFAVEFDTWNGGGNNENVGGNNAHGLWHVGINSANNVHSMVQTADVPPIFDGNQVHATVRYNRGKVQVWVSGDGSGAVGAPLLTTQVIPISHLWTGGDAVYGFTGATGGAVEVADVDNLVYTSLLCDDIKEVAAISGAPAASVAAGTPVTLGSDGSSPGAGDSGAITYKWSVVSGPAAISGSDSGATVNLTTGPGGGTARVKLTVDDGQCTNPTSIEATFDVVSGPVATWVRGDANGDKTVDISDPVWSLTFQFVGGPDSACHNSMDSNADGSIDISDPVTDLGRLFLGDPLPADWQKCENFPGCGPNCP